MLLEICTNGSLTDLLRTRKRLSTAETRFYMHELLVGVQFLHSNQIIHRDIKLGNLFLSSEMRLKIGDFGLAASVRDGDRKKTMCGTPNYIAPEILFNATHSFEVDVWSLGVVMFTLLVGCPPFQTKDVKSIYKRIRDLIYSFPENIVVDVEAKDVVRELLIASPDLRPSVNEVLGRSFFAKELIPLAIPTSALRFEASGLEYPNPPRKSGDDQSESDYLNIKNQKVGSKNETESEADLLKGRVLGLKRNLLKEATKSASENFGFTTNVGNLNGKNVIENEKDLKFGAGMAKKSGVSDLGDKENLRPLVRQMVEAAEKMNLGKSQSGSTTKKEDRGHERSIPGGFDKQSNSTSNVASPKLSSSNHISSGENSKNSSPASMSRSGLAMVRSPLSDTTKHERGLVTKNTGSPNPSLFRSKNGLDFQRKESPTTSSTSTSKSSFGASSSRPTKLTFSPRSNHQKPIDIDQNADNRHKSLAAQPSVQSNPVPLKVGHTNSSSSLQELYDAIISSLTRKQSRVKPRRPSGCEHPSVMIVKWIDYSNKYGLGYQLRNGSVGVYFNDATSIVLAPNKLYLSLFMCSDFEYLSYQTPSNAGNLCGDKVVLSRRVCNLDSFEKGLEKKVTLLSHFRGYMDDNLQPLAGPKDGLHGNDKRLDYVTKYVRAKQSVVFRLSNESVQVIHSFMLG